MAPFDGAIYTWLVSDGLRMEVGFLIDHLSRHDDGGGHIRVLDGAYSTRSATWPTIRVPAIL